MNDSVSSWQWEWNDPLPCYFCEGLLIPYLVIPGVFEFFSTLSSLFIIFGGIWGLSQKIREPLISIVYGCLLLTGIGSVLLHAHRVRATNLLDVLPMLLGLSIGIYYFGNNAISDMKLRSRNLFHMLLVLLMLGYFFVGILLVISEPFPGFFGIYFGGVLMIVVLIGVPVMFFVNRKRYHQAVHLTGDLEMAEQPEIILPIPDHPGDSGSENSDQATEMDYLIVYTNKDFNRLCAQSLLWTNLALLGKMLDLLGCNQWTVWLMPHSIFHISITIGAISLVTLVVVFSNLYLKPDREQQILKIKWFAKIIPFL